MPLHRESSARNIASSRKSKPFRAIVVDRTESARRFVCRVGEQAAGHDSHWLEAPDAGSASDMLAAGSIDLIVADSGSISGDLETLTAPPGRARTSPLVVVLSDNDEPRQIQRMLDAGAECCLPKNLPPAILERELRQLVVRMTGAGKLSSFPKGS